MKKSIFLSVLILALAAFFSGVFSFNSADVFSKQSATGTIKVCWAQYCSTAPQTTVVNLVDSRGNIVGTCTITPAEPCCKITGDFPTGAYHFEYYRPTGTTDCKTADFQYLNGTDVTMSVICQCP